MLKSNLILSYLGEEAMNVSSNVTLTDCINYPGNRPEIVADRGIDPDLYVQYIRELEENNRLLEVAKTELQAENTQLRDRVEHIAREKNQLQSNVVGLEERNQYLNSQVANMREQILAEREQRRAIQARIEVVGQQALNLGDQLNQMQQREGHLLNEIEDLRARYGALAVRTAEIKDIEGNLKAQNDYLHGRYKRLEENANLNFIERFLLACAEASIKFADVLISVDRPKRYQIVCNSKELTEIETQHKIILPKIEITLQHRISTCKLKPFERDTESVFSSCLSELKDVMHSQNVVSECYQSWPREEILNYLQKALDSEKYAEHISPFSIYKIGGDELSLTEENKLNDLLCEISLAWEALQKGDCKNGEIYCSNKVINNFLTEFIGFMSKAGFFPRLPNYLDLGNLPCHLKLVLYKSTTIGNIPVRHYLPAFLLAEEADHWRIKKLDEAFSDLKNKLQA